MSHLVDGAAPAEKQDLFCLTPGFQGAMHLSLKQILQLTFHWSEERNYSDVVDRIVKTNSDRLVQLLP